MKWPSNALKMQSRLGSRSWSIVRFRLWKKSKSCSLSCPLEVSTRVVAKTTLHWTSTWRLRMSSLPIIIQIWRLLTVDLARCSITWKSLLGHWDYSWKQGKSEKQLWVEIQWTQLLCTTILDVACSCLKETKRVKLTLNFQMPFLSASLDLNTKEPWQLKEINSRLTEPSLATSLSLDLYGQLPCPTQHQREARKRRRVKEKRRSENSLRITNIGKQNNN